MADHAKFNVGEVVYALNTKYRDGTRLRATRHADRNFNGVWLPNDTEVTVLSVDKETGMVEVEKGSEETGWLRARNLTKEPRADGVTKDVPSNSVVTPDPEYVAGIRLYGVGIMQDPIAGLKQGKGVQHLISSQWTAAMSAFVGQHIPALQAFCRHAREGSMVSEGYDYKYFTNMANHLFCKADVLGLKSAESLDYFLMATWLIMAASEVDHFPFRKYTAEERSGHRQAFYDMYENATGPGVDDVGLDDADILGKFSGPVSRRDLLPPISMVRLGVNNELSALKYTDPEQPLREGFLVSKRIDSLKRHFEGVFQGKEDEDHIIHLLWNFHAIYHVCVVFPHLNDLIDYSVVAEGSTPARRPHYAPTTSLQKITDRHQSPETVLKLDWNEGGASPPPAVLTAITAFAQASDGAFLKWYPHLSGGEELRGELCDYTGCIPENLMVTNGSDDALILICQAFLGHGKVALCVTPTYEHFAVNAEVTDATLIRFRARDPFVADEDEVASGCQTHNPDVVYLVSPNNPSGVQWNPRQVRSLASRFPNTLFICDEAYYEFGQVDDETGELITCVGLACELENVIVTRTFSKAFCLAAVRCGYLVAHPTTVERLRAFYNPKSVNAFAEVAAYHALLERDSYYKPYITATNNERTRFLWDLRAAGVDARSGGGGNFVCIHVPEADLIPSIIETLEEQRIYVRDIRGRFPAHFRVSIGLRMDRVTAAIVDAMNAVGALDAVGGDEDERA